MNVFNLMNNQSLSIAQEDVAGVSHLPSPFSSFLDKHTTSSYGGFLSPYLSYVVQGGSDICTVSLH